MKRPFASLLSETRRPARRGARPRVERLEDRLPPGEAGSGLAAIALGVGFADPVGAILAILGEQAPTLSLTQPTASVGTPDQRRGLAMPPAASVEALLPFLPQRVPSTSAGQAPILITGAPPRDGADDLSALMGSDSWQQFAAPGGLGGLPELPVTPRGGDASGAGPAAPAGPQSSAGAPVAPGGGGPSAPIPPLTRGGPVIGGGAPLPGGGGGTTASAPSPAVVTVEAVDDEATELGDEAAFLFTRTGGDLGDWLTVSYELDGDSVALEDFDGVYPEWGFVEFPPNETTVTITVPGFYDVWVEPDETLGLYLTDETTGGLPGYIVGAPGEAEITIHDTPPPVITVAASDAEGWEQGPNAAAFTFTRSGELTQGVTVFFSIEGSALPGFDYSGLTIDDPEWPLDIGAVEFAPGETQKVVQVTPELDDLIEGDETVVVTLLGPAVGTGGGEFYQVGTPAGAAVTIHDAAVPAVAITASAPSALETGATAGQFTFTRQGDLSQAQIAYFAIGGTAQADSDYWVPWGRDGLGTTGWVVIPATQATLTVDVLALADNRVEGDETIVLTPGLPGARTGPAATVFVEDDPPRASITATIDEAWPDTGDPAEFQVARSGGDRSRPLTVYFSVGGTATPEVDYDSPWGAATSGSVVIPAWESAAALEVTPLPNQPGEVDETVELTLAAAPYSEEEGYEIAAPYEATAMLRVGQPPAAPPIRVYFQAASSDGLEVNPTPQIAVELSRASTQQVAVQVQLRVPELPVVYRATSSVDFNYATGPLVFEPGETLKMVPGFVVIDDAPQELNEVVQFALAAPVNAVLGPITVHNYIIVDELGGLLNAKGASGANYANVTPKGDGVKVGTIEGMRPYDGSMGVNPAKSHLGSRVIKDQDFRNPTLFPVVADQATTPRNSDHASLVVDTIGSDDAYHTGVAPLASHYVATQSDLSETKTRGLMAAVDYYRSAYSVGLFNHSYTAGKNDNGANDWARFLDWSSRTYDLLHVIGAGNDSKLHQITKPGDHFNGITVGAVNSTYEARAHYSSYWLTRDKATQSDWRGKPEILAFGGDGTDAPQVWMSNGWFKAPGTSFASPQVTGVAALLGDLGLANRLRYGRAGSSDHLAAKAIILNSARKRGVNGVAATVAKDYTTTGSQFSDGDYLGPTGNVIRPSSSTGRIHPADRTRSWAPSNWVSDRNGVLTVYCALDDEQGTGLLDASRAITQHQANQQSPGNVQPLGWDLRATSPADGPQRYNITSEVKKGQFLTVTVCWDRVLDEEDGDGQFEANDKYIDHPAGANDLGSLPRFDVAIYDGNQLIATASGRGDSVTHLHVPVPGDSTGYNIRVVPQRDKPTVTKKSTYAVAWWGPQN